MKIRSDFVTNSSSSSFIGYGFYSTDSNIFKKLDFKKVLEEIKKWDTSFNDKILDENITKKDIIDYFNDNEISDCFQRLGFSIQYAYDEYVIGFEILDIIHNESYKNKKIAEIDNIILEKFREFYPDLTLDDLEYINDCFSC